MSFSFDDSSKPIKLYDIENSSNESSPHSVGCNFINKVQSDMIKPTDFYDIKYGIYNRANEIQEKLKEIGIKISIQREMLSECKTIGELKIASMLMFQCLDYGKLEHMRICNIQIDKINEIKQLFAEIQLIGSAPIIYFHMQCC